MKPEILSRTFIQSHIVYVNPTNPFQWISLNGVRGLFSEKFDSVLVLAGPPTESEESISFFKDPFSLFLG